MTTIRPRRLRTTAAMRSLVRETRVSPAQLVLPVFVVLIVISAYLGTSH